MSSTRDGRPPASRGFGSGFGRRLGAVLLVGALSALGCAHARPPVQPWQREHLAKRGMRLDLPDETIEDRFHQHWLGSREGSDLGFGEPGGGCGCN
jgi:hypothetical protein